MAKATRATRGHVYFLHAPEVRRIKIGFSVHLINRLRDLELGSPTKLNLLKSIEGTFALEIALLAVFARYRLHGEWFRATPDLLAYIERLKDGALYTPEMLIAV